MHAVKVDANADAATDAVDVVDLHGHARDASDVAPAIDVCAPAADVVAPLIAPAAAAAVEQCWKHCHSLQCWH